ncbi:MAG: sigma-70 family RNA polymerase sigma factor [Eubacteriales bacterium]
MGDIVEVMVLFRRSDTTRAIELLQEQHGRFLYATAYGVCHNEEDSKDIIQNVLIKLAGLPIARFPTTGESSWLYTLIRHEAIDYIKYHKHHTDLSAASRVAISDCNMDELFDLDTYETMIASLNEKQKEVVTMKVLGEMSHKEIARILGKPTGTIQWIYNTSIGKLRVQLTALASLVVAIIAGIVYHNERNAGGYLQSDSTSSPTVSDTYETTTDTSVESADQEEESTEDRVEEESSEGVLPQDDVDEESSEEAFSQEDLDEEEVTTEGTVEEVPPGDTIHSFQGMEGVLLGGGILVAAVVAWLAILLHRKKNKK